MFTNMPAPVRQPAGNRVTATTTTGATVRYRPGVPVEIWRRTGAIGSYEVEIFHVFIGGRLALECGTHAGAVAYAARF